MLNKACTCKSTVAHNKCFVSTKREKCPVQFGTKQFNTLNKFYIHCRMYENKNEAKQKNKEKEDNI